uniref:Exonuclease n=1 Tax=Marseillevirus LCMAC101 TaxID=2506602 RepID=A0A481YS78_9VIRU|nr:MAG: exonuclease [Marseillevirus LCMAC101]
MASFQEVLYYVVLDFEATCLKEGVPRPQEIIEFPSVIVDVQSRKIISKFQRYVKPIHCPKLSNFCTELTGITQDMVDKGCTFQEAVKDYSKWLHENGLMGSNFIIFTCGHWDLQSMYPRQCNISKMMLKNPFKRWINIKIPFKQLYNAGGGRSGGMVKMMEQVGLKLEGRQHSGIDDCWNTARLLIKMMEDGFQYDEKFVSK